MASSPRDLFSTSDSAKAHINSDLDESFDSLHHTIGKGATQAAAGNHKHPEYAASEGMVTDHGLLTGREDDDHPQYYKTSGGVISGAVQIAHAYGLQLHYPGDSVASMMVRLYGGQYTMHFYSGWDYASFAPIVIGRPIDGNCAARVDWVDENYASIDHEHGYPAGMSVSGSITTIPNASGEGTFGTGTAYVGAPVICNGDFPAHNRAVSIHSWDSNGTISYTNTNPGQNLRINFHVNVT